MSDKKLNRLVANSGSFLLTGTSLITVPTDINICVLVGGDMGCEITSIRLENENGVEFKYADDSETFDWDGQTLGSSELLEIPQGYRLKTLTLASGYAKGILDKQTLLKSV